MSEHVNTGAQLFNTIRAYASEAYQDRIPESTAENIQEVGKAILNYEPAANEFVNSLINRIYMVIIDHVMATNVLAPFKKGMMEMGQTIEQVHIDLIKAQVYDPRDAQDTLFKRYLPNAYTIFHQVNSELMYPISISNEQLRKAFISYNSFDSFLSGLIDTLYTSAVQDEYLQMKELIATYGKQGLFQTVTIPAIIDKDSAEEAMVMIKAMSDSMTFLKTNYNSAGVWTSTPKKDQYLIVTPEINARLDVSVLAKAFNMEKAEFTGHIIVVDDYNGIEKDGFVCFLVDRKWMQVYDYLRTMKEAYNGKGMYWNYFYHVWMIYSVSRFANAIAFISGTPTVTSVTVEPSTTTLSKGGSVQLDVTVAGTNNATSKCTYTISGNTDNETIVTPLGKVVIGSKEEGPTITVTATSVVDSSKKGTCTITIS